MIGGFVAGWWHEARELSEAELRLMEAVASQAGVALQNARLFQDNQRRVQELSVLHELSRAVTGQLDQSGLLDTVYQQVTRVLEVQSMAVVLLEEEHDRLRVVLRVRARAPLRRRGAPLLPAARGRALRDRVRDRASHPHHRLRGRLRPARA